DPEYRIKYYPMVSGILLGDSGNRLLGQHKSSRKDDIEYAKKLWDDLDLNEVFINLEGIVKGEKKIISGVGIKEKIVLDNSILPDSRLKICQEERQSLPLLDEMLNRNHSATNSSLIQLAGAIDNILCSLRN
ncbi:MAG: hypothetical protein PHV30_11330, partial [Candidatus Margulisbacteria bacterium]|nr:hypothetical protein [Candidatus Margulisiibacteriota bacterium]